MSVSQVIAFALFAIVAAATPGPSNVMLSSIGANRGIRRGLPCLAGVVAGMGLMIFLATIGLGSLVAAHPTARKMLTWAGIIFLLRLAWKIATAAPGTAGGLDNLVGFRQAAAFQWVNPKSWLVSASAAGAYVHAEDGRIAVQAAVFGVVFMLAALPSCFAWLALGASLRRRLSSDQAWRRFNRGMGLLLAASVIAFVV